MHHFTSKAIQKARRQTEHPTLIRPEELHGNHGETSSTTCPFAPITIHKPICLGAKTSRSNPIIPTAANFSPSSRETQTIPSRPYRRIPIPPRHAKAIPSRLPPPYHSSTAAKKKKKQPNQPQLLLAAPPAATTSPEFPKPAHDNPPPAQISSSLHHWG